MYNQWNYEKFPSRNIVHDNASMNLLSTETAPTNEIQLFSSRIFKAITKRRSYSGRNEENKMECKRRRINGNPNVILFEFQENLLQVLKISLSHSAH